MDTKDYWRDHREHQREQKQQRRVVCGECNHWTLPGCCQQCHALLDADGNAIRDGDGEG